MATPGISESVHLFQSRNYEIERTSLPSEHALRLSMQCQIQRDHSEYTPLLAIPTFTLAVGTPKTGCDLRFVLIIGLGL